MLKTPKSRIDMFGYGKTLKSNVRKSKILELECLRKAKHWIPMSGKAKIQNSKVWKSKNTEFQCLEKPKYKTPHVKKKNNTHNLLERQNTEFQCLKSQNAELRYLEEPKHWIPFFNPLSPKSDQHEISHCNINANRVVMEITDMVTQDEFTWYFINFSPLLL